MMVLVGGANVFLVILVRPMDRLSNVPCVLSLTLILNLDPLIPQGVSAKGAIRTKQYQIAPRKFVCSIAPELS